MDTIIYSLLAFMTIFLASKTIEFYYKFKNLAMEKEKLKVDKIKAQTDILKIVRKDEFLKLYGKNKDNENIFELYCSNLLSLMGYKNIEVTPLVADGGKDIIATKENEKYYIECKLWDWTIENNNVGRPVVQKLVGAMYKDGIKKGMIITSAYFTDEAKEYTKSLPKETEIKLFDGDSLVQLLEDLRDQWIPILSSEIFNPVVQ